MTARSCRRWSKSSTATSENINVKNNTIEWADFYQRLPAAVQGRPGPDVGVMHLDQLATNAARNVIVPLDDVAEGIGLEEDDFTAGGLGARASTTTAATASRSTCTRWRCTTTHDHFEKAGITEPPTDEAVLRRPRQAAGRRATSTPFWMPDQWPAT